MATRQKFIQNTRERRMRKFSEEFKRKKVREIEQKISTIAEISRTYDVRQNSVSHWVTKYSNQYMKGTKTIVESESDTHKILEYKKRIAELERIVGQKQIQVDFLEKVVELAEEEYGVDIKKKFVKEPSSTFGQTEKS